MRQYILCSDYKYLAWLKALSLNEDICVKLFLYNVQFFCCCCYNRLTNSVMNIFFSITFHFKLQLPHFFQMFKCVTSVYAFDRKTLNWICWNQWDMPHEISKMIFLRIHSNLELIENDKLWFRLITLQFTIYEKTPTSEKI